MTLAIEAQGLTVRFGSRLVLDGLDLAVAEGEVFALLGANGAGKTTTIGVLTTLLRPTAGMVRIAGADAVDDPVAVRRRIALTGQSAAVDDVLTGTENLVMLGRLSGLSPRDSRERARALLRQFDLEESGARRVGTYSGGMRRRLDIALSFVVRPAVLFLDEPTTGLDTRSRRELWDVIRTLADTGTTVFLTTQYLEEADRLADRVALIEGGRIVAAGSPAELKRIVGDETVEVRDADGALLHSTPIDGSVAGLRAALDELDVAPSATVELRRPSLDDVFLAFTADGRERAASPVPSKELS